MFALPNIHIIEPVEVPSLALVYSQDDRVQASAAQHKNFTIYLKHFSAEFGDLILPSLIIWDDQGPEQYRNTETLAAFHDALALSVVPYAWSHALKYGRAPALAYSNYFSIYPWMTDKNYEHIIMRSTGALNIHSAAYAGASIQASCKN